MSTISMTIIPFKFTTKGDGQAAPVTSVGALIEQLRELPPDMPLSLGIADGIRVQVRCPDGPHVCMLAPAHVTAG